MHQICSRSALTVRTSDCSMQVPLLDVQAQNRAIRDELHQAVHAVMEEGEFILGPAVKRFEQRFADYLGCSHCVGVNSGTTALHLALLACDIGPGDEVITTPHSWISTSWAISYVGARPVFVDIDPQRYTLDPKGIEQAITQRTRAILPVHLYGQAADLSSLEEIADRHRLHLIEDVAQAQGALYQSRRLGSIGKAGCFSFYPSKNLGAFGEAGAVVTNDSELAERMRRLRNHAQAQRDHHLELGYNGRMDGLQGAVLDVKLRYLDQWNAARSRHAARYQEILKGTPNLVLPKANNPEEHVWHLFVVLVPPAKRDLLRQRLAELGVTTGIHYPTPIPFQPPYLHLGHQPGDFPIAEEVMKSCLSLPLYPELSVDQCVWTAEHLRTLLERGRLE